MVFMIKISLKGRMCAGFKVGLIIFETNHGHSKFAKKQKTIYQCRRFLWLIHVKF